MTLSSDRNDDESAQSPPVAGFHCPPVMMVMMSIMMLGPLVMQAAILRSLKRIERYVEAVPQAHDAA